MGEFFIMKLTNKQVDILTRLADLELHMRPELRQGQCLFNTLHRLHPDLSEQIRGTDNDCFYDDNKISNFFKFLGD